MTPEQLAVERDALLQGGRTLEEVERMQTAASPLRWCRVETRIREQDLLAFAGRDLTLREWDRMAGMLGRELATAPSAIRTQRYDALTRETVLRLEVFAVSPPEARTGASAPRPSGETP